MKLWPLLTVKCVDTDVGVTEPGRNVVDDALVEWSSGTSHHIYLWFLSVPSLCCVNHVSCPCVLRRSFSVSNSQVVVASVSCVYSWNCHRFTLGEIRSVCVTSWVCCCMLSDCKVVCSCDMMSLCHKLVFVLFIECVACPVWKGYHCLFVCVYFVGNCEHFFILVIVLLFTRLLLHRILHGLFACRCLLHISSRFSLNCQNFF